MNLLDVDDLHLSLPVVAGSTPVLRGLSFDLARGGTLGLIGESGSGKSLTALALMGLLPDGARTTGFMHFDGIQLNGLDERQWCALRGRRIAMIFQEPMTALNPLHTIGHQIAEPLRLHLGLSADAARARSLRLLDRVRLPRAAQRSAAYPHQLSGGQRQRVMIAMALACGPQLLIADEPTTALDSALQREVLGLIADLVREDGMSLLLISHDLALVAERVERLLVMRDGVIVEAGATAQVLARPEHPYTRQLQSARQRTVAGHQRRRAAAADAVPLLRVEELTQSYRLPRPATLAGLWHPAPRLPALQRASFTLHAGRSLGVVGASGSGKSTLARLVMALETPASGRVLLDGVDLHALDRAGLRKARPQFQMVFQDPYGSLDPRRSVLQTVAEPLVALLGTTAEEQQARVVEALVEVGLSAADLDKYPHAFSGGQRQRIAIARALITRPRLIVADEALSALDVSVQAQVLELLLRLQRDHGIAYLFISHDLAVVDSFCDEVIVLEQGRVVEHGAPRELAHITQNVPAPLFPDSPGSNGHER